MEIFVASRLTAGNRFFPSKISIDETGVTFKDPGLFSAREKTIPFSKISSVDTDCPFIGFSTIIIETTGEGRIKAHGFKKNQVLEMKDMILKRI